MNTRLKRTWLDPLEFVGAAGGTFDSERHIEQQHCTRALAHRSSRKRGCNTARELQIAVGTLNARRQRDMKAIAQIVMNRAPAKRFQAAVTTGPAREYTSKQNVRALMARLGEPDRLSPCGEQQIQTIAKSDPQSYGLDCCLTPRLDKGFLNRHGDRRQRY